MKRSLSEGNDSDESKKVKVEDNAVSVEIKEEVKIEDVLSQRKVIIKVELRLDYKEGFDYNSPEDDDNYHYVDADDESSQDNFEFGDLGYEGDYKCCRHVTARVLIDGVKIGNIEFVLIDRENLGCRLSFWEVCDAESGELEQIASKFFKDDGSLKPDFSRRLEDPHGMAQCGTFMYIESVKFNEPYGPTATDENAEIAALAIRKLIHAYVLLNEDIMTTLVMYIPDGGVGRNHSPWLLEQDARQFTKAGFERFTGNNPKCNYMYFDNWP